VTVRAGDCLPQAGMAASPACPVVLLVEDDRLTRLVVRDCLKQCGFSGTFSMFSLIDMCVCTQHAQFSLSLTLQSTLPPMGRRHTPNWDKQQSAAMEESLSYSQTFVCRRCVDLRYAA
jgi:CheY-like chemotaxis protein